MNDTHTFNIDGKYKWTFTVKKSFLTNCPNLETIPVYDLLVLHKLTKYFHNLDGPAVIRHRDGAEEYWVNGDMCKTKEDWLKVVSNNKEKEI